MSEGGRRRNLNISSLYRHLILGRRPFFFFYLRGQQQQPVTSHKEYNQLFQKIILLSLFFTGEKTKTKTFFSASIPLFSQTRSERDGNYLNNFLALFFWVFHLSFEMLTARSHTSPPLPPSFAARHSVSQKISGKFVFALQLLWNQYGAVQPHPSQFHFAPPPPARGRENHLNFSVFLQEKYLGNQLLLFANWEEGNSARFY